jgi:2'-5' RNA ligase
MQTNTQQIDVTKLTKKQLEELASQLLASQQRKAYQPGDVFRSKNGHITLVRGKSVDGKSQWPLTLKVDDARLVVNAVDKIKALLDQ